MGSSRKFKRERQREQYGKFSQAWRDEKRFQQYLVNVQGSKIVQEDERQVIVDPDGNRVPILGRKPTFREWSAENQRRTIQQQIQEKKRVDIDDLSWEEDTVRQNSRSASTEDVSGS